MGKSVKLKPLVEVTWRDAFNEFDVGKLKDLPADYIVYTVGYLLSQNKRFITLAQETLPGTNGWRNVSRIPVPLVQSVRHLVQEEK